MKNCYLYLFLFIFIFAHLTCATNTAKNTTNESNDPSLKTLKSLQFGRVPNDYKDLVKDHFRMQLIDPQSAIYEFDNKDNFKKYVMFHATTGEIKHHGWLVGGKINSKNKFGGYVGWRKFYVLMRNDNILRAGINSSSGQAIGVSSPLLMLMYDNVRGDHYNELVNRVKNNDN